jgi:hypothetical protein
MASKTARGRGKSPGSKRGQFAKGTSGNLSGRPLGSPNRSTIIRKVLDQFVTGEIGGQKKKVKLTEAVLLRLAQQALTGDKSAMAKVLDLWKESEEGMEHERGAEYPFSDADKQVIDEMYARMKASEA